MFSFLKKLFGKKPKKANDEVDNYGMAVAMACLRSGKPVIGSVQEDGSLKVEILPGK